MFKWLGKLLSGADFSKQWEATQSFLEEYPPGTTFKYLGSKAMINGDRAFDMDYPVPCVEVKVFVPGAGVETRLFPCGRLWLLRRIIETSQ